MSAAVEGVLHEFEGVLKHPKQLPHKQRQDHAIQLKDGAIPPILDPTGTITTKD